MQPILEGDVVEAIDIIPEVGAVTGAVQGEGFGIHHEVGLPHCPIWFETEKRSVAVDVFFTRRELPQIGLGVDKRNVMEVKPCHAETIPVKAFDFRILLCDNKTQQAAKTLLILFIWNASFFNNTFCEFRTVVHSHFDYV